MASEKTQEREEGAKKPYQTPTIESELLEGTASFGTTCVSTSTDECSGGLQS